MVMKKTTQFATGGAEQNGARVTRYPVEYNDCAGGCCCCSREAHRRVM